MNREQRRAQLFNRNQPAPAYGGVSPTPDRAVNAKWFHTDKHVVIAFERPVADLKMTVEDGRQWIEAMTKMLGHLEAHQAMLAKAPENLNG